MKIEIFALCDAATEQAGKLNLLGAFDKIQSQKFPFVHPHCTLTARLRFSPEEAGSHQVEIKFEDSEGENILPPLKATLDLKGRRGRSGSVSNLILNLQGIRFQNPGEYSVVLEVNGEEKARLPLSVAETLAPRPGFGGQNPSSN